MARRWIAVPAAVTLAYAIAVVVAAWRAPDKGFQAFVGHRVTHVEEGGVADRAGVREGDVIVAVDGKPIASTIDYVYRVLDRAPGEHVTLGLDHDGARRDVTLVLETSPPPWAALVATLLAAAMLVLGLMARASRPDDVDARRFYRTTVAYAALYAGALSWSKLIVHPVLAAGFLLALFIAPAVALSLSIDFPHAAVSPAVARRWRRIAYALAGVLGLGTAIAVGAAVRSYVSGGDDHALGWVLFFVASQVSTTPVLAVVGLVTQIRAHRRVSGELRAQLRWVLFAQALTVVPVAASLPISLSDLDKFLIYRYQPFLLAVAVLWALGYGLAVLRIRLADVDALIRSSLGYVLAASAAVLVYVGVVLAAGWATGALVGDTGPAPHFVAAVVAVIVFGPLRARVTRWLDRRFFRDRGHYVEALRRASESLALVREPAELARQAVEQIVEAVRAERGALYVRENGTWTPVHAVGDAPASDAMPVPPDGGIAVAVADPRTGSDPAWLVLGPRKRELYSSADRDLLAAVAGQLAVALANARAFGKIKALSRTLEDQNAQIRELRDKLEDENRFLRKRVEAATEGAQLVGDSKAIRELTRTVERVASSDASVLLLGESGTGKGLLARLLHASSPRAERPFMQVDCGAIAASVFESELFGHERGAFTGATRMRRGPLELADGGTLFLDEIGELPLELQPKLLRVLEERVVVRVGATQPVPVDVRIIAATNRDLDAMVARGQFREDLYFRLRVVEITVPPLRARRADVPALCESLLPRIARRAGRDVKPIAEAALARMMAYAWPGNVRELENVLERALVLGDGPEITADDLELSGRAPVEAVEEEPSRPHDAVMDDIERRRLSSALAAAEGNQSQAAKALGMPRTTFINKLRKHGLL